MGDEPVATLQVVTHRSRTLDEALSGIGARVKARREALGLSLEDVARRAGLSKSHVWEFEQSRVANPTVRGCYAIAGALGWTLSECIGVWEHADILSEDAMRLAVMIDDALIRARTRRTTPEPKP